MFWSWFLIHWKPDFLPRCMKEYTLSSIHNCPIRYNFCLLLLNKEDFYVIISPPWFSVSQASLISWEYHYGLHLFPNTVDSTKTTTKMTNQLKNPQQYNYVALLTLVQRKVFPTFLRIHLAFRVNIDYWADHHSYKTEHGALKQGERLSELCVCTCSLACMREGEKKKLWLWVYILFATFQRFSAVPKKASAHKLSW